MFDSRKGEGTQPANAEEEEEAGGFIVRDGTSMDYGGGRNG